MRTPAAGNPAAVPHYYAAPSTTATDALCARCGKPRRAKIHLDPAGDSRYPKVERRRRYEARKAGSG